MRILLQLLALAFVCSAGSAGAQTVSCGIVLMHGKWGMPQSPYLQPVADKLRPHCQVVLLEMPWSRQRMYDRPYGDALEQVRQAAASFRQSGVQWVAVGGQSFGANAALAYMAQVGDVDALIVLAPGHVPENFYHDVSVRPSVDEAQRLVEAGKGETSVGLTDINQGRRRSIRASATSIWSYFNPHGLGNMSLSAQGAKKSVPVFWAIGNMDSLYGAASSGIFRSFPPHPDSIYHEVRADHANTPDAASDALASWVLSRLKR